MSVNYHIIDKKGNVIEEYNAICYYKHYSKLDQFATVLIFCNKLHMKAKAAVKGKYEVAGNSWEEFTTDEYKEYVHLLNDMGFKFTMKEEEKQFVFTLQLDDNKVVANKIILNAIRYLCEDPYPTIVKEFLRLCKQKMVGVNNYTKFILAHYVFNMGHGGHTFLPCYNLAIPLSNKEFQEQVLKNTNNIETVSYLLPQCNMPFNVKMENPVPRPEKPDYYWQKYIYKDLRDPLFALFLQKAPLKDLIKEYKRLCKELA